MHTRADPVSLYLHIPFCSLKCAYCDFNSYVGLDDLVEPYCDALIAEIRLWSTVAQSPSLSSVAQGPSPEPSPVPTVFFGGGTPSLLPLAQIERIMAALRESFALDPDAEV